MQDPRRDTLAMAPIAVYDSGVGGVSVLRALRALLPDESYVYVADTLYAPYGDRDQRFLEARAAAVLASLAGQGVKAVVLACNTVSLAAAASLRMRFTLPIVAMEPAIEPAVLTSRSRHVLVLATPFTARSAGVARLRVRFGADARITLQPCPGLVEQVERGCLDGPQTLALLKVFGQPALRTGADTIVLGCTHYAFLATQIARIAGPGVTLIEPSHAVARQLERRLGTLRSTRTPASGRAVFQVSGDIGRWTDVMRGLGEPIRGVMRLV